MMWRLHPNTRQVPFAGSAFAPEQTFAFNSVFTPSNGIPVPGDINGDGIVDGNELNVVLSNYFPNSPWLYMTNVAGLGGTNVTFGLTNSVTGSFSVEYSTNLMDWYYLGPAIPLYYFIDTNAPAVPKVPSAADSGSACAGPGRASSSI